MRGGRERWIGSLRLRRFDEVNLVLSGGAAKGIAHIGVLKALGELGIRVKRVSGVSAGAIVATFFSAGYTPDRMLELLESVNWLKLLRPKPSRFGLISWEGAKAFLRKHLPVRRLEELSIPTYLCASDLYTGRAVYFSRGEIIPALLGSCAIPGIFEPVSLGDYLLVDGGVVNNLPVEPLEKKKEPLVCVDVLPLSEERRIKNLFHVLVRSFFLAVRSNAEKRREMCDVLIVPPLNEFSHIDVRRAREIFRRGYEETLRVFNSLTAGKEK
ncbi:MAG: patatin-like phospholipase family protein [Aquificae bacterium]|nr:patatin-like phospholipase family protein [Aquificota bacterium]